MTRPIRQGHNSSWKGTPKVVLAFGLLMILLTAAMPAVAEGEKKDDTGTNPVNFTNDFRFITEMQQFPDSGGSQIKQTLEWRAPLGNDIKNLGGGGLFSDMGKTFGLRFRAYHQNLSLNNSDSESFGTSQVSGIGDFDARILAIAYTSKKFILAPGLEAFFNTASNDALGSGKNTLAPVVFGVFLGAFGKGSLFAPGYQYVFDVGGDPERGDISRSQIDLYFVWVLSQGKNWFLLDPQIILDHENSVEFMTVDAEWGFMIVPKAGISGYVRPGVGVGSDRPFDYNLEFALKFIWR
jgi:hypothetical protein